MEKKYWTVFLPIYFIKTFNILISEFYLQNKWTTSKSISLFHQIVTYLSGMYKKLTQRLLRYMPVAILQSRSRMVVTWCDPQIKHAFLTSSRRLAALWIETIEQHTRTRTRDWHLFVLPTSPTVYFTVWLPALGNTVLVFSLPSWNVYKKIKRKFIV